MRFRCSALLFAALALAAYASAQQAANPPQQDDSSGQTQHSRPRGRGMGRGMGSGMGQGRGIGGTVTAVSADSLTVKTETGETYTVHFSANTRFIEQPPRPANTGQQDGNGSDRREMRFGTPTPIKATDIKIGDAVMAGGEVDEAGKSVGAVMVMQIDPERAKEMREMQANFGKTWLQGRVTAVKETTVTLQSNVDDASHAFVADENTTFRKRRDPITLADIQTGDMVRVEGAVKNGTFVATSVSVMGGFNGGPRQEAPQQ